MASISCLCSPTRPSLYRAHYTGVSIAQYRIRRIAGPSEAETGSFFHHATRVAGGNFDNQHIDRLVNLTTDIAERNDLSASEGQRRAKMQSDWDPWDSELMEPFVNQTANSPPSASATDRDSLFTRWDKDKDKDKDNQLSLEENTRGLGPTINEGPHRLERFDKDNNGILSREEFNRVNKATK